MIATVRVRLGDGEQRHAGAALADVLVAAIMPFARHDVEGIERAAFELQLLARRSIALKCHLCAIRRERGGGVAGIAGRNPVHRAEHVVDAIDADLLGAFAIKQLEANHDDRAACANRLENAVEICLGARRVDDERRHRHADELRRIVHAENGHRYRSRALRAGTVLHGVGERVGRQFANLERLVGATRVVQHMVADQRDHGARRPTAHRHQRLRVAGIDVGIVCEHIDLHGVIFVGACRVGARHRRVVHASDGDRHARRRDGTGSVDHPVAKAVGRLLTRAQVLERHAHVVVHPGAAGIDGDLAYGVARIDGRYFVRVAKVRIAVVRQHIDRHRRTVFHGVRRISLCHRRVVDPGDRDRNSGHRARAYRIDHRVAKAIGRPLTRTQVLERPADVVVHARAVGIDRHRTCYPAGIDRGDRLGVPCIDIGVVRQHIDRHRRAIFRRVRRIGLRHRRVVHADDRQRHGLRARRAVIVHHGIEEAVGRALARSQVLEAPIRVVSESAVAVIGHLTHGASDIDGNRVRVVRIHVGERGRKRHGRAVFPHLRADCAHHRRIVASGDDHRHRGAAFGPGGVAHGVRERIGRALACRQRLEGIARVVNHVAIGVQRDHCTRGAGRYR